jgi:diguanylate cyclase (GGDEF)-like protein
LKTFDRGDGLLTHFGYDPRPVMNTSKSLFTLMVSAAVALIVVSNFCILLLVQEPTGNPAGLLGAIWPIALPSTIAIVLVMSTLYQSLQDVLSRLEQERRTANELALRDPLTGLANKRLLEERIEAAISSKRRGADGFAVLMIDLDHFKRVNDLLGHPTGDETLKIAAKRLEAVVREGDTVARFGGDEFLILAKAAKASEVGHLCERILESMDRTYVVAGREASLPTSIGAVFTDEELRTAEDYVRAADVALYAAKASGRNCYRLFTDELDAGLKRRAILELDLRKCLASGQRICIHYQPQIDVNRSTVGVECLFRWTHPELGSIPAQEAITIAEESRQIDALGDFVLRQAARFARAHPELLVAVNVSPAQFNRENALSKRLQKILTEMGVQPGQIELEVTEQLFMRHNDDCEAQIAELRSAGFRLALDDFGTGYSSLNYLRRFKVDRLKLDRSFSCDGRPEDNLALLRAAVTLAHAIGIEVVAEGIETQAQEAVALEAGCDILQGNRYANAMDMSSVEDFLGKSTKVAA